MREQEQFLHVLDRDEAERRFRAAIDLTPRGIETVPLDDALGRVLAADVISPVDVPSFDRANVDGFAVVSENTFGASEEAPRTLELGAEVIHTGVVPKTVIRPERSRASETGMHPVTEPCPSSSPATMRSSVVFPDPDGPSSATSEPCGTSTLTLSRATKSPNRLVTLCTEMPK